MVGDGPRRQNCRRSRRRFPCAFYVFPSAFQALNMDAPPGRHQDASVRHPHTPGPWQDRPKGKGTSHPSRWLSLPPPSSTTCTNPALVSGSALRGKATSYACTRRTITEWDGTGGARPPSPPATRGARSARRREHGDGTSRRPCSMKAIGLPALPGLMPDLRSPWPKPKPKQGTAASAFCQPSSGRCPEAQCLGRLCFGSLVPHHLHCPWLVSG